MKVVLIEFVDEAKLLLYRYGVSFFLAEDVRVICLHPQVRAYLKRKGISSEGTVAYLPNDAQERIILKAEEWKRALMADFKIRDQFAIEKGYVEICAHHLSLYLNHFLWIIEILANLHRNHTIEQMIACIPWDTDRMYTSRGYIQDQERFLGILARDFCLCHGIKFVQISSGGHGESGTSRIIYNILDRLVKKTAQMVAQREYAFSLSRCNGRIIVVPALSYRMNFLIRDIKKRHHVQCVMIWEGPASLKQNLNKIRMSLGNIMDRIRKRNLLEVIIHLDLIKEMFVKNMTEQRRIDEIFRVWTEHFSGHGRHSLMHEGVDIAPYLIKKIDGGLKENIKDLQHSTMVMAEIFKKMRPTLLMSMYSGSIYYMLGELANRFNVPALIISHGTHVPPNNEFERIENYRLAVTVISNTYSYVAVQTPWVEKFLDYYQDSRRRLRTGPLLYSVVSPKDRDLLRKELLGDSRGEKIIVHAATQKSRSSLRFHITETLDEYISTLEDIIGIVNGLENVSLIIRPHPIFKISIQDYRTLLPSCRRMVVLPHGAFSRILSAADLLISYSSTCIEEATCNHIPVVLYDKWKRYNHFNLKEFEPGANFCLRPAYYVTRPTHLSVLMNYLFENGEEKEADFNQYKEFVYPQAFKEHFLDFTDNVLGCKTT